MSVDRDFEQERHSRRLALMRELGETNRLETRLHIALVICAAVFIALLFA